jgi:hypothetical protein
VIDVKSRMMRLLDCGIARTTSPATFRYTTIAFAGWRWQLRYPCARRNRTKSRAM